MSHCNYQTAYSGFLKRRYHIGSDEVLSFDFSLEYSQDLLIHEQAGGGLKAQNFVHRIKLIPSVAAEIRHNLIQLTNDYVAVHVRNTDLQTDYEKFFTTIYNKVLGKKVLLCSDDLRVIEYGVKFFDHSTVINLSNIPNLQGRPLHLHLYDNAQSRAQASINAIRDLVLLGSATELYVTENKRGFISGYSKLAQYLFNNKSIIQDWLGDEQSV